VAAGQLKILELLAVLEEGGHVLDEAPVIDLHLLELNFLEVVSREANALTENPEVLDIANDHVGEAEALQSLTLVSVTQLD